jgi:lipoyl(octanoyl) transferase
LRLYAWSPACLSLGYAQPFRDVDQDRLVAHGWQVVRRITGGRAILHVDELTYAVMAPYNEPRLAGNLLESYRRISEALMHALSALGLPVQTHPLQTGGTKEEPKPVCFEVPSNYEITVDGKKIVGSAQARKKPGILQHGTLPLAGDLARIVQALSFPDSGTRNNTKERLLSHATSVEAVLGKPITWEAAASAFIQGFSQGLQIDFQDSTLTEGELARVEELIAEKYANPKWTARI